MINNTPIAGEAAARAGNSVGAFTIWISIPSEREGVFSGHSTQCCEFELKWITKPIYEIYAQTSLFCTRTVVCGCRENSSTQRHSVWVCRARWRIWNWILNWSFPYFDNLLYIITHINYEWRSRSWLISRVVRSEPTTTLTSHWRGRAVPLMKLWCRWWERWYTVTAHTQSRRIRVVRMEIIIQTELVQWQHSQAMVGKCIYVNSNPGPQQTPTVCGKLCRNSLTGLDALLNWT